jgi:hypothetical protein
MSSRQKKRAQEGKRGWITAEAQWCQWIAERQLLVRRLYAQGMDLWGGCYCLRLTRPGEDPFDASRPR